jgi:hypothetical protein
MYEIFKKYDIKRISKITALGSGSLFIASVIVGGLAEFISIPWDRIFRTIELIVLLSFYPAWLFAFVYLIGWLISKQKEKASLVKNLSVFALSLLVLWSTVNLLDWLVIRARSPQYDLVEEICRKAFEDPSTLEKYQAEGAVIGSWDSFSVWEDESQNAIWFDTCGSLSSCGVVCVRDGIALKDSTDAYKYHEFKYLRKGLYRWD